MFSWLSEYTFFNSLALKIILFHDFLLMIVLGMTVFVGGLMWFVFTKKMLVCGYVEHKNLEFLWTLIPVFVMIVVFFPSIFLLKSSFNPTSPFEKIVKVIGHQWKWSYEYCFKKTKHSFTAAPGESNDNRLLETTGYVFVKSNEDTLFKMTSEDVIHSFSLPELGMKVDAVPGRIKEVILSDISCEVGIFYGQCSEICGTFHAKMPIVVVSLLT